MQKQLRNPLIVFAYIALGLASAGVRAADESDPDLLDAQQAKAQKELLAAKMAFRIRLPILPEYQKAKREVDDLTAKISDLRARKASDSEFDAAIKSKIAAEKSLLAVRSELEKKDPAIAQANEKIKKLSDRMDVLLQKERADKQRRLQEAERNRKLHGEAYQSVVNVDYSKPPGEPRKDVPLVGDETGLLEVQANPAKFMHQTFILCGAVRLGTFDDFGFTGPLAATHFAIALRPVAANAEPAPADQTAVFYLDKKKGESVVEVLSKRSQYWPNRAWCMRIKARVNPDRIANIETAEKLYEMIDWQYLGKDGWSPWYSEVVGP